LVLLNSNSLPADKADLDTPALLVDVDLLDQNIKRISTACRQHGVASRPHVKAIKAPDIVQRLVAAGAVGITCAKLSEAEVMHEWEKDGHAVAETRRGRRY
jgi:D-serine deaminase-like pyridoxal phosphate-dependent protein